MSDASTFAKMVAAGPPTTLANAQRTVRNLESIRRRIQGRELTGRNGRATEQAIAAHIDTMRDFWLRGEYSNDDPAVQRLYARWNRLERWSVGLPS
jgi:hypothetical protein